MRLICRLSDIVFVSSEEMRNSIQQYSNDIFIRPIPSNLTMADSQMRTSVKEKNSYVFFGLVNQYKAFEEMIAAWDKFNRNGDYTLHIITATHIEDMENKHNGVKYLYKKDEDEIIDIMKKCVACILPIKPCVDMKNATFKTGSLCGCICIGKFCDEYRALPFIINLDSYETERFVDAFERISMLTDQELINMEKSANEFGIKYTPEKTIEAIVDYLRNMLLET